MTTIGEKAAHVRREASRNTTFDHHCHWTGCHKSVPPAMWGCKRHWYMLPPALRARIWKAYRPGQEQTKDPSEAYIVVARETEQWIAANACGLGEHDFQGWRTHADGLGGETSCSRCGKGAMQHTLELDI